MHALLGADLLAQRGDPRICDERCVERVNAVPGRVSRVCAALCALVSGEPLGGGRERHADGTYVCPKYSAQRDCSAREDTKPISCVSPATGWHLQCHCNACAAVVRCSRPDNVHDTDVHVFVGTAIQEDLLPSAALLSYQRRGVQ